MGTYNIVDLCVCMFICTYVIYFKLDKHAYSFNSITGGNYYVYKMQIIYRYIHKYTYVSIN